MTGIEAENAGFATGKPEFLRPNSNAMSANIFMTGFSDVP
jgi:hypothetical protein